MGEMSGFESSFQAYSSSQLSELLEDDEQLRQIVRQSDEMQEMQQNKELMMASNRSLAEQNLSLQPELEHQKITLTKRYCSLQELHESHQLRRVTRGNPSLDTLLAVLQTEGAKIEEETEMMADSFLDGCVALDSFIDDYQSRRKLAHLRRVKIDKLQELVLKGAPLPPADPARPQEILAFPRLSNGSPAHVRPAVPSASAYVMPAYSCPYPAGLPPATGFITQ